MKRSVASPTLLALLLLAGSIATPFSASPGGNLAQQQPKFSWDTPPSPVLTGEASIASFRLPPGFRIELVASEPLVQNPVAFAFDPDGRLFVVEMRGYMPDPDGKGEDQPNGDVVILEDTDGDGKFDKRTVFLDGLVLPRSIALAHGGVIVGEPPNLWFCRDHDGDGKCDEKTPIFTDYGARGGPEYNPNGTLLALDNWFYSAHFGWRFRQVAGKWIREPAPQRGQYGLAQDDLGRLFYNANSSMLHADLIPQDYAKRTPKSPGGNGNSIARGDVFPGRLTTGINRAYSSVGPTGKMTAVTAACGPHIYRGHQFPEEFRGNAFVCEPAANLLSRQILSPKGAALTATSAHTDVDFLVSTDERFRPVQLATGPDGALYIADFHHGILQHKNFLSAYLRDQIAQRNLAQPLHLGRIFRVVHEATPLGPRPALGKASPSDLVQALSHPNGWWRDTAQRLLIERPNPITIPLLKKLATSQSNLGSLHALWTLRGLDALDPQTLIAAVASPNPAVRAAAIRLSEPFLRQPLNAPLLAAILALSDEKNPLVQMQLLLTLGPLPDPNATAVTWKIFRSSSTDPLLRESTLNASHGRELPLLQNLAADPHWQKPDASQREFIAHLATGIINSRHTDSIVNLLTILTATPTPLQSSLLTGIVDAKKHLKGSIKLPNEPQSLTALSLQNPLATNALLLFTWPGKVGAPPSTIPELSPEESQSFAQGKELYATTCAACHQPTGIGLDGVAPPILHSEWVLGSEDRLARIVLRGLTGKLTVGKRTYELEMPPLNTLTDPQIAAILTFIRREWGHEATPVSTATIARIRQATQDRSRPFTAEDLQPF